MNVTIKDIANDTGLSPATISKYLNHKRIHPGNKKLIEASIRELGYVPNRTAQALRSSKSQTVTLVLCDLGNYFWGNIISSVTHFFESCNYTVITTSYYHDVQTQKKVLQDIIAKKTDGVILLPRNASDTSYTLLQEAGIPVVLLDHCPDSLDTHPIDYVTSDNFKGGHMLGQYIIQKGHQHVAIMDAIDDSYSVSHRIRGVQDAFRKSGLPVPVPQTSIPGNIPGQVLQQGRQSFRALIDSSIPPSAVIFTNYVTALGAIMEAETCSCSIPEDLSVLTFDDDPLFSSMLPPITAVSQDLDSMGKAAGQLLLRRIHGDYTDFPASRVIDVAFRERESVRYLSSASRRALTFL